MELKDTIEMMQSEDFKERFKAEYWQLKIRYEKLYNMVIKMAAGTLSFQPKSSLAILNKQVACMAEYLRCLKVRAEIEGIDL
jgi:hypothetical protein